jgi:hypothetical protein
MVETINWELPPSLVHTESAELVHFSLLFLPVSDSLCLPIGLLSNQPSIISYFFITAFLIIDTTYSIWTKFPFPLTISLRSNHHLQPHQLSTAS